MQLQGRKPGQLALSRVCRLASCFASMILEWLCALFETVVSFFARLFSGKTLRFERSGIALTLGGAATHAIGEGAYSTVYRATDCKSSKKYALKKMNIQSPELERTVRAELDAFRRFQHPHILRLIDSRIDDIGGVQIAYLLFPLVKRGCLRDELNRTVLSRDGFKQSLVQKLRDFSGLLQAFDVLHSFSPPYVHQDIKPENVLLDDDGRLLLTDFGSVRLAEVEVKTRANALAVADEAAQLCTISYRAPELFDPPKGAKLDTRTDVWGIGCLLFAYWFGYSPFESEFVDGGSLRVVECSLSRVLSKMPRKSFPSKEDSVLMDLAEWILHRDFRTRPFTSDVISRINDVISSVEDGVAIV